MSFGYNEEDDAIGKAYDSRLVGRFARYVRPYWWQVALALVLLLTTTGLALLQPLLIQQAVSPVRWEESVQKLTALGCRRVIEIGPGKVLAGLVKRIAPDLAVDNFDVPQDVRNLRRAT